MSISTNSTKSHSSLAISTASLLTLNHNDSKDFNERILSSDNLYYIRHPMFHKLVKFNPWSYQLVQFRDGRFGARKGVFTCTYLGMSDSHEWYASSNVNRYCKGTIEQALKAITIHKEYLIRSSTYSKLV